jgi:hypothetical protein
MQRRFGIGRLHDDPTAENLHVSCLPERSPG